MKHLLIQHKAAYLVNLFCALIHLTVIGSDIGLFHTFTSFASLAYLVSQAVAYLLYPLLGWLADVYFTRYNFIKFSFVTMIATTIIMVIGASMYLKFPGSMTLIYSTLGGVSTIICLVGMGLFESTAIQFGMDQMLEASSDQLSTFIQWYYWSCNFGQLVILYIEIGVLIYFSQCVIKMNTLDMSHQYEALHPSYVLVMGTAVLFMAILQLICACIGLCLLVCSKRHLNIDRIGQHPLKLVYQVLRYVWSHTCPENHSAFTYW